MKKCPSFPRITFYISVVAAWVRLVTQDCEKICEFSFAVLYVLCIQIENYSLNTDVPPPALS